MKLFALNASRDFGQAVARTLGAELSPHEERVFEDGERKLRPMECVRGRDVYVVQGLHGGTDESVHDKLCALFFFAATLKDHGAARVTAVIPYLAYARKDRRTKPRDPVATRHTAALLEASGVDVVLTLETHNTAAYQNAFRIPAVHLEAHLLFTDFARDFAGDLPLAVASPDPGGVKRAQLFREALERRLDKDVAFAFLEKRRSGGELSGELFAGDVEGRAVLVVDDIIASGGTMVRAARACLSRGAVRVAACAAHGLFVAGAAEAMADPALSRVTVSDSVPPFRLSGPARNKLEVKGAAGLFSRAVRLLHEGGALAGLLEE